MDNQPEDNQQEPEVTNPPVNRPDSQPAEPADGPQAGLEKGKGHAAPQNALRAQTQQQTENRHGFTPEEQAVWNQTGDYNAAWHLMRQRKDREAEEQRRQEWSASQAGRLLKQLGEAYVAYRGCLERAPYAVASALKFDELNQRLFERISTNIEKANNAPRCARIMAGGRRCRAPRVRGKQFCHMHLAMEEARPRKISLPSLDDANGIQVAIAKAAQALVDGQLEQKQASLLAYYLQLAVSNVDRLDFEEAGEGR